MENVHVSIEKYIDLVPNRTDARPEWDWTAAFDALMNDPAVQVFLPPGTYRVRFPKAITKLKTINGEGATLYSRGALNLEAHGIRIIGLTIAGKTPDGTQLSEGHGITLLGVNNIEIIRCNLQDINHNAIQFSNKVNYSTNIKIDSCKINNIGISTTKIETEGMGIYVQHGKNVLITNCIISQTYGQSGIMIQKANTVAVEHTLIEDTKYRGIQTFAGTSSTDLTDVINNIIIFRCTIRRTGELNQTGNGLATNGVFIRNPKGRPEDVKITHTLIEYCGENFIEGTFDAQFNTFKFSGWYDSLETPSKEGLYPHSRAIIAHNKIISSKKEGVKLFGNRVDVIVQGNLIIDSGISGVLVQAHGAGTIATGIIVVDNIIRDTKQQTVRGVELVASQGGVLDTANIINERNHVLGIS